MICAGAHSIAWHNGRLRNSYVLCYAMLCYAMLCYAVLYYGPPT